MNELSLAQTTGLYREYVHEIPYRRSRRGRLHAKTLREANQMLEPPLTRKSGVTPVVWKATMEAFRAKVEAAVAHEKLVNGIGGGT